MNQFLKTSVFLMSSVLLLGSCSDENTPNEEEKKEPIESDAKYFGQAVATSKQKNGFLVVNWELRKTFPPIATRMKHQQ